MAEYRIRGTVGHVPLKSIRNKVLQAAFCSTQNQIFPDVPYPVFLIIAIYFGMIDRMGNSNSMVLVEYVLKSKREGLDQYGGLFLSREGPF